METSDLRLAELMCSISLATDLGTGQPMEHALRTCVLSQRAAEALGLTPPERRELYYVSLLRLLGCTSGSAEDAELSGGSELDFYAGVAPSFMGQPAEMLGWMVRNLGKDQPALRRAGLLLNAVTDTKGLDRSMAAHCEAGQMLAGRMGVGDRAVTALGQAFEHWDGKGHPNRVAGEDIRVSVRVSVVARDVELLDRVGGRELMRAALTKRAGKAYDPRVVDAFLDSGDAWLKETRDRSAWEMALEAEPEPWSQVSPARLDEVLESFGDFVDLKSPYTFAHSSGVARIAGDAGNVLGMDDETTRRLRRAALVHDLGRVGVANSIWDHRGPLSTEDWERVRLHPYYTERILARCSILPELEIACAHHERLDGSGYHRGTATAQLSPEARLLAAADAFQAMTQDRPHREALTLDAAVEELYAEVDAGRLDGRAVGAVAEAAGQPRRRAPDLPAGLTEREVEVLRRIAAGKSNKEAAAELFITPKTVGHHVEHIYSKIDVSTRAGAALFAMEHGLVA